MLKDIDEGKDKVVITKSKQKIEVVDRVIDQVEQDNREKLATTLNTKISGIAADELIIFSDILILAMAKEIRYPEFEQILNENEVKPTFTMIKKLPKELLTKHSGLLLMYIIKHYPYENDENILFNLIEQTASEELDNIVDADNRTVLHNTMKRTISNKIRLSLIDKMSQQGIDKPDNDGCTALHLAMYSIITDYVLLVLIDEMSEHSISLFDRRDETALLLCQIYKKHSKEVIRVLKKKTSIKARLITKLAFLRN